MLGWCDKSKILYMWRILSAANIKEETVIYGQAVLFIFLMINDL